MIKEIEVKNTDTVMNPHWNGEITIKKSDEPLVMEQTNAITIHEAPKELDSFSFMGVTAKTEYLGAAVIAVLVGIVVIRYFSKPVRRDSKGRRL
tara:strand:- start:204 stop:485 length:282 start_codon:yes stop_codon:yes gene_type:complete